MRICNHCMQIITLYFECSVTYLLLVHDKKGHRNNGHKKKVTVKRAQKKWAKEKGAQIKKLNKKGTREKKIA